MMEIFTGFADMLIGTCRNNNEKRDLPYIKLTYNIVHGIPFQINKVS